MNAHSVDERTQGVVFPEDTTRVVNLLLYFGL